MMNAKARAWLITIAMVVVSIFLGGTRSLNALKTNTANIFDTGSDSIQAYLDERAEYANNYIKVANKYISGDKTVNSLESAVHALSNAKTPKQKYAANKALTEVYTDLYNKLMAVEMSTSDAKYRQSIYVDMESCNDKIIHNEYNVKAKKYNDTLKGLPGNVLKMFGTVRELELFSA